MTRTDAIAYGLEPELAVAEFVDVLRRAAFADRRPVDDAARIETMLRRADIVATARDGSGLLVGISRAITDFAWACYLSDLAVDRAFQGRGIGQALIDATHAAAGPRTRLHLSAAPGARSYYPHIGMAPLDHVWQRARRE